MKKFALSLILWFGFAAAMAFALPPLQHSLNGVVQSIDIEKGILRLEPTKKDSPTELVIIDGRTKLYCDKKPAKLMDLAAGQTVHVYYKREMGREVATEVSWKQIPVASPTKVDPQKLLSHLR